MKPPLATRSSEYGYAEKSEVEEQVREIDYFVTVHFLLLLLTLFPACRFLST
jgi:hypothetical protein